MAVEGFEFGLWLSEPGSWADYLNRLARGRRGDPEAGLVPSVFLVAVVDDMIVGRTSIRCALNDYLAREGGHIGYGVLPDYRRRGYGTETLSQSLVIIRAEGVDRVLVTCDHDNIGSAAVIERCGGVLEAVTARSDGTPLRRYWID
jgi:predicted acetyltransferase